MAAVAPPADQASDLLQKLSLDSQAKTIEIPDATKKTSVDSGNVANGIQFDRSITPINPGLMDPTMCYLQNGYPSAGYYYGGFEGNEWEDYGVELTPGAYGDNGSLMYHHGYGFTPYGPYSPAASPIPTLGHDGQLYGPQHYQYPTPYFQSMPPASGQYTSPAAPGKGDITTSVATDQVPLPLDSSNPKSNVIVNGVATKGNNGTAMARPTHQSSSFNVNGPYVRGALPGGISASAYQDPRFSFDGLNSPIPWLESPYFPDAQPRPLTSSSAVGNGNGVPPSRSQNYRHHPMGLSQPGPMSAMNSPNGYINRMFPNKLYGQYGSAYRSGVGYGSNGYDTRPGGRGWTAVDSKYKPRGRGNGFYSYGNENMDGLNELNRGPRTKSTKNIKGFTPVTLAVKGQNIPLIETADGERPSVNPDREQYNRPDFPETYADAKFFIIKSYSEDDVHKSIKYNIWASTPNGNKKLDAAYQSAQQKSESCPVFLFFSVNTSGQFVGVAEMVGPVDFDKNVEYWQQDKWIGCFPVKWHIVKDVPNSLLKHITLENNENKPVTNSRDTQEVKLEQGLQVLKIFKDHISKQCILDDFDFYEDRQKKILEKKAKQQHFHKQSPVWEGKTGEEKNKDSKEYVTAVDAEVESPEVGKESASAAVMVNGNSKVSEQNDLPVEAAAAIPEKKTGVNGC